MTVLDIVPIPLPLLLELAIDLSNVSKACKLMGYSRQQFYEIRRNFQTLGADGLLDRLPGAKGPQPNWVAAEVEQAILDHALEHPCQGPLRVAQELVLRGIQVFVRRRARGLAAPRPADPTRAPAAPGEVHRRAQAGADRRAGAPAGAVQPGAPRAPYRGAANRRPGGGRHLLRRHAEGCW